MEVKLNLTIKDRAVLPGILPSSGSLIEQRMVNDIVKSIEFTKEEEAMYSIKFLEQGNMSWSGKGNSEDSAKEFSFSKEQFRLLKDNVKKLDDERKVNQVNIILCEKVLNA